MEHVLNPPKWKENGIMTYTCAKCGEDFDADIDKDMTAIEEFEDVFNEAFYALEAEDKMVVCTDCYNIIMRVN